MRKFVLAKKYWIIAAILISGIGVWFINSSQNGIPPNVEIGTVERISVEKVVSETGHVTAARSVELAFKRGGKVSGVLVEEGTVVEKGDALIALDGYEQQAELTSAYAKLDAEQARLQELLAGADSTSLAVTESAVAAAKTVLQNAQLNLETVTAQQDQLVTNALQSLRSSGLQAYLKDGHRENSSSSFTAPTITGTYTGTQEGIYAVELYSSGALSGSSYRVTGLENDTQSVSTVSPTPLGTHGLYVHFPEDFAHNPNVVWEIPIPNTRAAEYLTNANAYASVLKARDVALESAQSAVDTAQAALTQREQELALASGSARDERIVAQQALVRQMEAAVGLSEVAYNDAILIAPFSGTVTNINAEVGEIIQSATPAVSLISDDSFEVTVDISEVDIAEITIGDKALVSFTAYDDLEFTAHVSHIAPSATVVDGVRVFAVTLVFDEDQERIKHGLSADVEITTAQTTDVIAIPTRAIYEDQTGKFVRVVVNNDRLEIVRITTGLRGSNGYTEIQSGLNGGERIVTFANEEDLLLFK